MQFWNDGSSDLTIVDLIDCNWQREGFETSKTFDPHTFGRVA